MGEETATKRRCIKCREWLSLGMFDDRWYARTFICINCRSDYQKKYKGDIQNRKRRTKYDKAS